MLTHLIRFSIRHYGVVIALAVLIVIYGSYRFITAGLDIFPEFSPKQVIIQTEAPGFSAEQVELLVSQQIEMAIGGTIGLQTVRSESIQGLSIVTAVFPETSDVYRNRQLVTERLNQLSDKLPKNVSPTLVPLSSSSATVLTLGLASEKAGLMALRGLVDWKIAPRLLAVPGVADVNVFGGEIKQLQIQIKPDQLLKYNVSLAEVREAIARNVEIAGSGFIENSNQRFTVQLTGRASTPAEFGVIAVKYTSGRYITLADVADIGFAPKPAISQAQMMGRPGVIIMVIAQYGANTLSVSKALETTLQQLAPTLTKQGIDFYPHLFRPADYIERSISNLTKHLLVGGIFVLVVLYLFLANAKASLISALAIPVSLLGASTVLLEMGVNLNIMVLGGLAIALGEVVDDAIIDTENIFRRLRENQTSTSPLPKETVIGAASLEVRSSVVYASFIVALAFVPLLTLEGVAGRLFAPLGFSYILAILLSLLVALTLTPALCYALLWRADIARSESRLIRRLKAHYRKTLCFVNLHFKTVMVTATGLCALGFLMFAELEHKFLPELREGHFIVHTTSLPGTSLTESIRLGSRLTGEFLKIDGVESVSQWAGRAERGADTYGSHYSEYEVRLKPASGSGQQRILDELRATLSRFPGILFEANTFLTERVDETIAGYTAPVVVNLYGNDLPDLDAKAQTVAGILNGLPGVTNVQVRSPPGTPLLTLRLDQTKLNFWGIDAGQVLAALQLTYETVSAGKLFVGNQIIDIALTLPPSMKTDINLAGDIPLTAADGTLVRLRQVAEIRPNTGRYNILHQNLQRKQTVTANIIAGDMDEIMAALEAKVNKSVSFSADSYAEFTGSAVEQGKARRELYLHSLFAGAGVLLFIYVAIGNLRQVLLTLANLPFALIGGVIAVVLTGTPLSVGSVVGFITLFGITVRNTIMLLSHCQHKVNKDGLPWNFTTLSQAAEERLPAILMTALVTALAMFPIAFNSDNPGSEIMGPMAAIIIGGLFSSTLLNLLLLPCLLQRFGQRR